MSNDRGIATLEVKANTHHSISHKCHPDIGDGYLRREASKMLMRMGAEAFARNTDYGFLLQGTWTLTVKGRVTRKGKVSVSGQANVEGGE